MVRCQLLQNMCSAMLVGSRSERSQCSGEVCPIKSQCSDQLPMKPAFLHLFQTENIHSIHGYIITDRFTKIYIKYINLFW